jgi:apolipoprotein N-acyltransferase
MPRLLTRPAVLAAAGGLLFGAAFLSDALAPLAWVCFVPLLAALERTRRDGGGAGAGFRVGWTFGCAAYLLGAHWLMRLSDVAITVPWLKYPAWLLTSAYLGLYLGAACALVLALARRTGAPVAALLPPAVVVFEAVRGSGELGFPWFQPGYSQHALLPIVQMASVGGVMLVTVWVLIVNALAWSALAARDRGARARALAGVALALVLPWLWGQRMLKAGPVAAGNAPTILLVQGNVAGEIKWSGRHQREIVEQFVSLSRRGLAGHPRPVLIVWPETATGSYLRRQLDQTLAVTALASGAGVPVFAGFPDYHFEAGGQVVYENAAGLFPPDGVLGPTYAKIHLVPFGERMPFQRWIPALGKVALGQAEWTPGTVWRLFPSSAGPFGCLICFESIYPDHARRLVRSGARWLVNVTNDEWFGDSPALGQHAAMAVFRAVEHHVPLARCANTGITEMVDANGRVTARLPVWRPGTLACSLPPPGLPTPYTRLGDWPTILAPFALTGIALAHARRAR